MGKMTTYLLVMSGIMVLMYYGGLIDGGDTLLTLLLNPAGITYSNFFQTNIISVIEGLAALGVTIGLALSGKPELGVMGGLAIFIADLGFNFVKVFVKLASMGGGNYLPLAVILFAPLLVLFGLTIAEWWRGVTT